MPQQLTITAKTGPGQAVAALVLGNLKWILFDMDRMVVTCGEDSVLSGEYKEYGLTGVDTITCTVSGRDFTWVIS